MGTRCRRCAGGRVGGRAAHANGLQLRRLSNTLQLLASLPICMPPASFFASSFLSSPQNIGKAVYKDKDQIIEQLRKAYPPFKEAKEFEFAFKIR